VRTGKDGENRLNMLGPALGAHYLAGLHLNLDVLEQVTAFFATVLSYRQSAFLLTLALDAATRLQVSHIDAPNATGFGLVWCLILTGATATPKLKP
jgi:hypothetical protein